ncbi:MAG: FixH family protein [Aliiglaciecola sp.]|uniref:FixH family protein n=1 Tax=unclassified Aliiglaciecola TaxID=2593648 RepID=UPI003299403E
MNRSDKTPWYKQFWPWFLITIPVVSICLSVTMLNLALNTEDSLVIDDYYKEGKGINLELTKIQEAKAQGISTVLTITDNRVQLEFLSGKPNSGEALKLHFYHATLQDKDFSLLLTQDANGIYKATAEEPIKGKWKLTLSPLDEQWKIMQDKGLPQKAPFNFNP